MRITKRRKRSYIDVSAIAYITATIIALIMVINGIVHHNKELPEIISYPQPTHNVPHISKPIPEQVLMPEEPKCECDICKLGIHHDDILYTEQDAIVMAQLLYNECRGVPSQTRQACVAWTVLNRYDNGVEFRGDSIEDIIKAPNQYAWYSASTPVVGELLVLSKDVLNRWSAEKLGVEDVGRVLPSNYYYFGGDGEENYFRPEYRTSVRWDYSLESPYSD